MAYKKYTVEQIEAYAEELISSAQDLVRVAKRMRDEKVKAIWLPWANKHIAAYTYAATMGREADNGLDELLLDLRNTGKSRREAQAAKSQYVADLRARKKNSPKDETRGR